MNKNYFLLIFITAVALGGVFYFTRPNYQETADSKRLKLFENSLAEKVARIKVEKGADVLEVAVKGSHWSLPGRNDYPADSGKVNSFLLKFFSLSLSQRITSNPKKYEKFGLTEESIKEGKSRVTFFDSNEKVLGTVYVGDRRKGSNLTMSPNMPYAGSVTGAGGRYIRRDGEAGVYLSDESLPVQTSFKNWLDQSVVNIIGVKAERIEHYGVKEGDASKHLQYSLVRKPVAKSEPASTVPGWKLEGDGSSDAAAVSLVSTGLQNLRMDDVFKDGAKELEQVPFNMLTRYFLSDGLRYDILSAEKEDKTYIKVSVIFDPEYAKELKAKKDKEIEAAKVEAKKAEGEEKSPEKSVQPKVPPLKLSNVEEATKLNAKYKGWAYLLPEYLGKKFRQDFDLITGKVKEVEESKEVKTSEIGLPPKPDMAGVIPPQISNAEVGK